MIQSNNFRKNKFILRVLIVSALIVFIASIEALMSAKSKELFDVYLKVYKNGTFPDFINLVLINFLLTILEPALIALYTFFIGKRFKINLIYKVVFTALLIIRFINLIIKFNFTSVFYFIILILYFILIVLIVTYPTEKGR